ncbi:hypothetical protein [uncultured Dokdonia sp.]|uniref:hypothetical protein n=1 Tax=uncultured Dokdonia sp. TaxID=575653 RepID=UPI00262B7170|nr:hypothetical protein [uncultured Dokdonia sp.]
MIVTKKILEAQRLIQLLIETALHNEEFKQRLISDPIQTIEKVTGKPSHFPKGIRIQVEDQSDPSIIYINLPIKPRNQYVTSDF